MGCSRHPRLAPLAAASLFAILVLTSGTAAACPPEVAPEERSAGLFHPRVNDLNANAWSGHQVDRRCGATAAPQWTQWHGSGGPAPLYGTNPHHRRFRPSPLLVLALATGLLWLALRGVSFGSGPARVVPPSPNSVISLACRRCSRVVDLPRQRLGLTRDLFCPRCGATLPRDA